MATTNEDEHGHHLFGPVRQHMTLNDKRKRTAADDDVKMEPRIRPLAAFSRSGQTGELKISEKLFSLAGVITK